LNTLIFNIALWIDRRGAGWALLRTTALSSIYYFLIGAFPNLTLILLFAPLTDLIGTQALVLMLGVLRLLGAALFVFNPVREPRKQATNVA